MKRERKATWQFRLREGPSVGIERRACNVGFIANTELLESKFKAVNNLVIAKVEQSWLCNHINSRVVGVIKLSSICLETAYPVSFHEKAGLALISVGCLLFDINSDSREVVASSVISEILAIRPIDIRIELRQLLDR